MIDRIAQRACWRMLLDDLAERVRHDERNAAWLDDLPEEDDWFERSSYA